MVCHVHAASCHRPNNTSRRLPPDTQPASSAQPRSPSAGRLGDLLQDVNDGLTRAQTRVAPAKDPRHAVGTPTTITLAPSADALRVNLHSIGEPIVAERLERIVEHDVSDQPDAGALDSGGQGPFMARAAMARTGRSIATGNGGRGAVFTWVLQRAGGG